MKDAFAGQLRISALTLLTVALAAGFRILPAAADAETLSGPEVTNETVRIDGGASVEASERSAIALTVRSNDGDIRNMMQKGRCEQRTNQR